MDAGEVVLAHLLKKQVFVFDDHRAPISFSGLTGEIINSPALIFVLDDPGNKFISETDLDLLRKMTDFIGVEKENVCVINLSAQPVSFRQLKEKNAKAIIAFGIESSQLSLQLELPVNKLIQFMDLRLLFTESLPKLAGLPKNNPFKNQFFESAKNIMRQ